MGSALPKIGLPGVFPTAIAYTAYGFVLSQLSATQTGILTYLITPITIILGLVIARRL